MRFGLRPQREKAAAVELWAAGVGAGERADAEDRDLGEVTLEQADRLGDADQCGVVRPQPPVDQSIAVVTSANGGEERRR
jgi:hypothetical protein